MFWIFWASVVLLAYTFAGYPLLLGLISLVRRRPHHRAPIRPTVSLIIPVHNEAGTLREKIENSLALRYPPEKREIIIASDGSSDGSVELVRSYAHAGLKLVDIPERHGKHYAQMMARDLSSGEILVFTDVSVRLEETALEAIVSNFADPSVGCVSSEDQVMTGKGGVGEGFYVRLEMGLRRLEATTGSLVGVSGSFFAARRPICEVWHSNQSSDFFVPLHTVARGMRTVVDSEARGLYGTARQEKTELYRKVRTVVNGLDVFFTHLELLNPLRHGFFSWQLFSHKLCRWLAPFGFAAVLISSLFLWKHGWLYRAALVSLAALLLCGLAALSFRGIESRIFRLAGFFLMGSAATIVAWLKFCSGERFVIWQPTRRA